MKKFCITIEENIESVNNNILYDRIKHLEFIQNTIKRMADNSLSIKKFCSAFYTAILVVLLTNRSIVDIAIYVYILLMFAIVNFTILDAYYLALEREYRDLYNKVYIGKINDFSMSIKITKFNYLKSLKSLSVWGFYIAFLIGIVILNMQSIVNYFLVKLGK